MEILDGKLPLSLEQETKLKSLVKLTGKKLRPLGPVVKRLEEEIIHTIARQQHAPRIVWDSIMRLEEAYLEEENAAN
jgi:hypothetical protein